MNTYRGILATMCRSLAVVQSSSRAQDRADTIAVLDARYRALIDAENRHDIDAVRSFCGSRRTPNSWPRPPLKPRAAGRVFGARTRYWNIFTTSTGVRLSCVPAMHRLEP